MDWTYIVLVMPAVLFSLWASARVNSTFQKYQKQRNSRNITGAEAARQVLDSNGLYQVRIEQVAGELTDHYDPSANVIRLSNGVYGSTSTAAVGVACHEAGHAIQYAVGYAPIRFRAAIIPVTNIGSKLAVPLIFAGLLLGSVSSFFVTLAYIGVFAFSFSALFQLVTLPTEINASRRALQSIESANLLYGEELEGAKKALTAAALTYVAALAVSLTQILRFLVLLGGRRRND